jgi:PAS domain S-box-containing protein
MLKNMKIMTKLLISMILIGLVPMLIITYLSISNSSDELKKSAIDKLNSVRTLKAENISAWFDRKKRDLEVYADNSAVRQAAERLITAFNEGGLNGENYRKWDDFHGIKLRKFSTEYNYYDLFFIDLDGNVVWTAAKEADLGKNLISGELANSPLGKIFKKSQNGFAFVDFEWYNVSNEPAAFIGLPINDLNGNIEGVIVCQLSLKAINKLMQERTGMGKTGETYLVGPDKKMRSDSYLDPEGHSVKASFEGTVENNGVDTEAVNQALSGKSDTKFILDYNGNDVLSSFAPMDVYGLTYVVVAEIDKAEIEEPVDALTQLILIIALIIIALVAAMAFFMAKSIVNGIKQVINQIISLVGKVIDGKLDSRGNTNDVGVDFTEIIDKLNELIDAFVTPINVTAEYVDRISKGDIPPKITDEYKGDFNEIKNNLNTCIDAVDALVSDAGMLAKAAKAGQLDTRADAMKHGGDFREIVQGVNDTLDNVIGPLNVAAEYVDRISKGDIPPKITDQYNGDFNEIKNNLNTCIDAVNALVSDAGMLAKAAKAGQLDTRADATKHGGDFRAIVEGVNNTLDSVIGPLNVAAEYVDRISKGDIPPKITDEYNGDFNEIKNNLNTCIDAVNALVADAVMLAKAAVAGQLDTRADASKHGGDFREIVEGVNKTLDNVIGPLNVAAEYVDRISKGDIPPKITDQYNGDFNEIKNNLNTCIDAVNALVADAGMLAKAAKAGQLDTRADASKHGGDFRDIVEGVNNTLDSVIGPLNVAAEYVDRISKGDIPPKITDQYNGDFNEIKNNLNTCIDAVNALVADAVMLAKAAVAGQLDTRADASKHGGDFREIVEGVNKTLDNVIGPLNVAAEYVDRISKGDIPPKITDQYNGDFNEIKNNLNVCIDAVNALVKDADMLVVAASKEEFETRADADKHAGDFQKIIKGINKTLELVAGKLFIYEASLDSLPFPVSVTDLNMNWIFFNKSVADLTGLKREEMIGKQCSNWNADICETDRCGIQMLRKGNLTSYFKQPGQDMDFQVDTSFIIDKGGNKLGHIEVIQDITAGNRVKEYQQQEVNNLAEILEEFSNGNLDITPKVGEGDKYTQAERENFEKIIAFVNKSINAVNAMSKDVNMIVEAAIEGQLDTRADASKHNGDFRKIVEGFNKTLDNVIGPLNVAAEYVDRISKGDIPPKITDDYKGDFNEIKNNLNTCIDAVNALVNDANTLARNAMYGRVRVRGDVSKHGGDFAEIIKGVNGALDSIVGIMDNLPLPVMGIDKEFNIQYMNKAGAGLTDKPTSEVEGMKCYNYFKTSQCQTGNCACHMAMDQKKGVTQETDAHPGKLDLEISYSGMPIRNENGEVVGAFEAVVDQTEVKNAMAKQEKIANYQNKETDKLVGALETLAKGDFTAHIEYNTPDKDTQAAYDTLMRILTAVRVFKDSVIALGDDTKMLAEAALNGNLDTRADAAKHNGEFSNIIVGFNKTLDNVIGPLNVAAEYVDRISKGDLPPKITEEYKGDFNEIKNNLNKCIDAVQLLVNDSVTLAHAAVDGKLDSRADAARHMGDFAKIIEGVNDTLNALIDPVNEASKVLSIMASGDLTRKMAGNYNGDNDKLKEYINSVLNSLTDLISQVSDAVQQTASAAVQISSTADAMAASSEEQSAQADEVASAVEEMSRTITENAMAASKTAEEAERNKEVATEGGRVVEQTVGKMRDIATVVKQSADNIEKLGESSKQIGEIISVIDDIADQTNLLALNAAIEAARAGEQGRGFAVVADEVRKLAERTTEATKQIATMIKGIQSETQQAVEAMKKGNNEVTSGIELADRAGNSLEQIVRSSQEVQDMINQIAAASEEQSSTSEEIAKNVASISEVSRESAKRVQDIAHSSDDMAKLTEHLRDLMNQFKIRQGGSGDYGMDDEPIQIKGSKGKSLPPGERY